jgi:Flp pilus assembly protein TadD
MASGRESRSSFLPLLLWVGLSVFAAPARVWPCDAEGTGEFLARGELALRRGDLAGAEKAFRQALAADAKSVAAYADLGVVYMRRQQWPQALIMLRKAEGLAPPAPAFRS